MEIEFLTKKTIEENLPGIKKLYKDSFDRTISEDILKWRYIDNPVDELLFVVCKDKGNIIASYSASPCLMVKDNEIYKTAISLNTMTHPNYRGQGLFVELANELYKYMEEKEYTFIWGFPNNLSNRTFIDRLEWETIYEVPTMTLELERINKSDPIKLLEDSKFELDYSALENKNIKNVYVKKDKKYLGWRYYENPTNDYTNLVIQEDNKVSGYIIIKEYNDIINIVDINYINLMDAQNMISHVIEYARDINKNKVTLWAPINTKLHSNLEKTGFYNDYPIRYLGGKILDSSKNRDGFLEYKNWFIHAGDNNEY